MNTIEESIKEINSVFSSVDSGSNDVQINVYRVNGNRSSKS